MVMGGWKTWLGVISLSALGILDVYDGNIEAGITKSIGALSLVGIGSKIEKTKIPEFKVDK